MLTPAEISLVLTILEMYEQNNPESGLQTIMEDIKIKLTTMQQFACEG